MLFTATEICSTRTCGKPLSFYFEAVAVPRPGTGYSFSCPVCGNRIVAQTTKIQEIAARPDDAVTAIQVALKSILVVDDQPDVRDTLSIMLSSEGFYVRTCKSRDDALELLTQEVPNLIIVDWHMPGMGLEPFVDTVRQKYGALPIALYSAAVQASIQAESLLFLPKTLGPVELISKIRKWCADPDETKS